MAAWRHPIKVFWLFSALGKSKNTCPWHSANEKPNRTEPICIFYLSTNRTETNREPVQQIPRKRNRIEPTPYIYIYQSWCIIMYHDVSSQFPKTCSFFGFSFLSIKNQPLENQELTRLVGIFHPLEPVQGGQSPSIAGPGICNPGRSPGLDDPGLYPFLWGKKREKHAIESWIHLKYQNPT